MLLPGVSDRGPRAQGPPPVAPAQVSAELPPPSVGFERRAAEVLDDGPVRLLRGRGRRRDHAARQPGGLAADRDPSAGDGGRGRAWNLRTTLLGRPRPQSGDRRADWPSRRWPTPTASGATARAAAGAGSLYCLSSLATTSVADLARGGARAPRAGCSCTCSATGASPTSWWRRPPTTATRRSWSPSTCRCWGCASARCAQRLCDRRANDAFPAWRRWARQGDLALTDIGLLIDPTLTWADIEAFAARSGLPVLVKGVLTAEDARLAAEHGAAGVVVSNHGGRQLDTVLSGADALPAVVEAVGDRLDVIVDGGVRRGHRRAQGAGAGSARGDGRPPGAVGAGGGRGGRRPTSAGAAARASWTWRWRWPACRARGTWRAST